MRIIDIDSPLTQDEVNQQHVDLRAEKHTLSRKFVLTLLILIVGFMTLQYIDNTYFSVGLFVLLFLVASYSLRLSKSMKDFNFNIFINDNSHTNILLSVENLKDAKAAAFALSVIQQERKLTIAEYVVLSDYLASVRAGNEKVRVSESLKQIMGEKNA